jgi:HD-GYP domain-containing protein (c-di-GMP phosphodiesterase class II)
MNRGNVDHDRERFDEAELAFLDVLDTVDRIPADVFSANAPFGAERFRGMLCHNICTNRLEWARREARGGAAAPEHLAHAEYYLAEALELPLAGVERIQVLTTQAAVWLLSGDPAAAEMRLVELAHHCAVERELMVQLPEIYRRTAEACVALGDTRRAVVNCYRALESSLAVADRLQERRVVETFVAVLRLSSSILIEPDASPERKAERIESEGRPLVDRLVDFLERKDWYTGHNHSRAVETISIRMARALCALEGPEGEAARSEIEWNTLRLAATLHDIGKLTVPWSLLNKLIPLSESDRVVLRRHPEEGRRILADVGLGEIGDVVVQHHEAPDGSGYPTGTRESSLMGAVIAVADAFEAMTTVNRRYRTPKTREQAVREVLSLGGKQFDARVARALERALERRI